MHYHSFDAPERFVVGTVGAPGEREFFLQATQAGRTVSVGLDKAEAAALAEGLQQLIDEVREQLPPELLTPEAVDAAPLQSPVEEAFRLSGLSVAWDGRHVVVEAAGAPAEVLEEALRERLAGLAEDDEDDEDEVADRDSAAAGPVAPGPVARDAGAQADPAGPPVDAWLVAEVEQALTAALEGPGADPLSAVPGAQDGVDLAPTIGVAADDAAADAEEEDDDDDLLPVSDVLRVQLSVGQARAFATRIEQVVAAGRPPCLLCGRPDGPGGHLCPRLN